VRLDGQTLPVRRPPPALGGDTDAIAAALRGGKEAAE
jgi:hypothetical protein